MQIIIISIFIGFILAVVLAPIIMILNKRVMNEIKAVADNYEKFLLQNRNKDLEYLKNERRIVVNKLIALKAKLYTSDKKSVALAADILNNI